jgi:type II secretory pathway pseudopilin PulG
VWTVEILLTILLLIAAAVALIQITGVSQDQQQLTAQESQLQQLSRDVSGYLEVNETGKRGILYYNTTTEQFINTESDAAGVPHYVNFESSPNHPFAGIFSSLNSRPVNYQLTLAYTNETTGTRERFPLVYQGAPRGTPVTTSTTVVLNGTDQPHGTDCTLRELSQNADPECQDESYLIPPLTTAGDRYNVVTVRLTVWQS